MEPRILGREQGGRVQDAKRVVFVVDDEVVIAQTLSIILNQAGFQATAFYGPEEAIAARPALLPDLCSAT
jgi:FixJ family two-component response regulator